MTQDRGKAPESQRQLAPSLDISVVVPCFNEELNIPELAERVLRMFDGSGLRGELVLVDDGSADRTAQVIRSHSEKDARVVGVFHRVNRGMAGAWRTGVNAARGAWLVARCHAVLGQGEMALHHARRSAAHVAEAGDLAADFDHAYAHEATARALACLGRLDEARAELELAKEQISYLSARTSKDVVQRMPKSLARQ